jgi:hypothetical protein
VTRSRRDAPALGVPVVDEIAAARARRAADKEARRARHIADSQARADERRTRAAATCADPDALRASLQASIAASLGDCPVCRLPWGDHGALDLKSHVEQVFGVADTNPSSPIGA